MRMRFGKAKLTLAITGLTGVLSLATAARADVKAGVDAWSVGDFSRAVAEWRAPAAKGDPDALFNLAQAYRLGRGVPQDLRRAETLYQSAAALGHMKAADNYGLLLFQSGRREQALPYVTAAAERGDPRAQYLVGIAYFNGDFVAKDWVRAYALLTLANAAGLPQAASGLAQMDGFISLDQRQQAQVLAAELRTRADAQRASQLAAADLAADVPTARGVAPAQSSAAVVHPAARAAQPVKAIVVSPSVAAAEAAVAEAMRATGTESPATAGADYARPGASLVRNVAQPLPAPARVAKAERPGPTSTSSNGPWKLQLGAFSVAGNADKAWAQASSKPALAGKTRQLVSTRRLTRLLAAGWPSQGAAQSACNSLKSSGQSCIVTR